MTDEPHFLAGWGRSLWKLADYITDGLRRGTFKRKDDLVEAHWEIQRLLEQFVEEATKRTVSTLVARESDQVRVREIDHQTISRLAEHLDRIELRVKSLAQDLNDRVSGLERSRRNDE